MKKFVMNKNKKIKNNGGTVDRTKKGATKSGRSRVTGAIKHE